METYIKTDTPTCPTGVKYRWKKWENWYLGTKSHLFAAQFVISKSQKCAWLVSQNREAHRNRRTNLSMPTIGESADRQTNSTKEFYPINGRAESEQFTTSNLLRARRARSMKLPASSHHSLGAGLSRSFRRRSPAALEGSRQLQKCPLVILKCFLVNYIEFGTKITP